MNSFFYLLPSFKTLALVSLTHDQPSAHQNCSLLTNCTYQSGKQQDILHTCARNVGGFPKHGLTLAGEEQRPRKLVKDGLIIEFFIEKVISVPSVFVEIVAY